MQFDEGVEKIREFLTNARKGIKVIDQTDATNKLPVGWKKFADIPFYAESRLDVKITHIKSSSGLLRLQAVSTNPEHPRDLEVFDLVSHKTAARSSAWCLVCGQEGYRRKTEEYWPPLCEWHFIQYVNWLDQNGYGKPQQVSDV